MERSDWRVVDCRFDLANPDAGGAAFAAGHVPGAVYAHLDADLAAPVRPDSGRHPLPERTAFTETARRWGISADTQVVACDDGSGAIAARLWWLLRWVGHDRVAVLDGGMAAWEQDGRPIDTAVADPAPGDLSPGAALESVLDTAELARRLGTGEAPLLVDARDPARYAGEVEPIDPVAGHVPGAVNFPFAWNIGEGGRWRTGRDLRRRWQAALDAGTTADWAVMCGSGVTACHLVLSARIAGLPAPRLYAGSWSEWIRDPSRPVAGAGAGHRPPPGAADR